MPRYKHIELGLKLIPVEFSRQVLPGSFEHALCVISSMRVRSITA